MSFSSDMQDVARELLTEFGEAVSVSRSNMVTYDADNGTVIESSPTNYSGVGHPSEYDDQYIDNVNVLKSDIKLLFYSTTMPIAGDVFDVDSISYTAISVIKTRAQGADIYYTVQLRQ